MEEWRLSEMGKTGGQSLGNVTRVLVYGKRDSRKSEYLIHSYSLG